jgi:hypothetical protein
MRFLDFLAIIGLAFFWYAAVPLAGSLVSRYYWKIFQKRFKETLLKPLLDYKTWLAPSQNKVYRFLGFFEALSDNTVWVKNSELTAPVNIAGTRAYFSTDETLERVRWDRLPALSEGAKIFVAGEVLRQDGRLIFADTKKNPLIVIFYSVADAELARQIIATSRNKNAYWNKITPYALITGAFSLIATAAPFLNRPAFRFTVLTAFTALFLPLFPFFPPGILFTLLYRFFIKQAMDASVQRDLWDILEKEESMEKNAPLHAVKAVIYNAAALIAALAAIGANIFFIVAIVSILVQQV